jgi:Ca2+-binding RTX toxin-like protein
MTISRRAAATLAAVTAVLLAALAIASAVSAATVEVRKEKPASGPASVLEVLEAKDAVAEDNELSVRVAAETASDFEVELIDRVAALTAGPGCKGGGRAISTVTCTLHKPGPEIELAFRFDLGGGHNFFEASNLAFPLSYLGGSGKDVVVAGTNDDTVDPGAGEDTVYGNPGNDLLIAPAIPDAGNRYDLGQGFDTVSYAARTVPVLLRGKTVEASGGSDTLEAVENIVGGAADDVFDDEWPAGTYPAPAIPQIEGGPGDDLLEGGVSGIALLGGPGDDTLIGGGDAPVPAGLKGPPPRGINRLSGEAGDDRILSGNARDLIDLGQGNDSAYAGASEDRIDGGPGRDLLDGDEGDDLVIGDAGSDRLFGGSGEDRLFAARKVLDGQPHPLTEGPYDGGDRVGCGPDGDRAFANPWDTVRGCERVVLQPRPKHRRGR